MKIKSLVKLIIAGVFAIIAFISAFGRPIYVTSDTNAQVSFGYMDVVDLKKEIARYDSFTDSNEYHNMSIEERIEAKKKYFKKYYINGDYEKVTTAHGTEYREHFSYGFGGRALTHGQGLEAFVSKANSIVKNSKPLLVCFAISMAGSLVLFGTTALYAVAELKGNEKFKKLAGKLALLAIPAAIALMVACVVAGTKFNSVLSSSQGGHGFASFISFLFLIVGGAYTAIVCKTKKAKKVKEENE